MSDAAGRTLKLTVAYDGTRFVGWQRQAAGESIQGLIEEALGRIEGGPVTVVGAGRTDAGVHALAQVASVTLRKPIETSTLRRALNATLPPEIRITEICDAPASFHARYSASSKTYRYNIVNGPAATPFEWRYAWHVREPLDLDCLSAAAAIFEGEHDFAAFRATGSEVKTTVRRVLRSRLLRVPASGLPWAPEAQHPAGTERLTYEVTATGFLRHMVRTMVATLVDIGAGRRDGRAIEEAFASRNRADAGPTAPACGLFLVEVQYSRE